MGYNGRRILSIAKDLCAVIISIVIIRIVVVVIIMMIYVREHINVEHNILIVYFCRITDK